MRVTLKRLLVLVLLSGLCLGTLVLWGREQVAHSQDLSGLVFPPEPGEEASPRELEAFRMASIRRFVAAREIAQGVLDRDPKSYVGHFVMGYVLHYGEANFPRALYHLERAFALYTERHGKDPDPAAPWRWHARLLQELAQTHGDLEHHAEKLRYLRLYSDYYDPDLVAEQAWPLMKMGQYKAARMAAQLAKDTGSPRQVEVALNALCAIEFEAGNDGASYAACKEALEYGRAQPGGPNAVDLTNFSEASRSLFKLDEAERIALEATEAQVAWYGNPWIELGELYLRQGRFGEAHEAMREVPQYRLMRPVHVRDSDRAEGRRALSSFLLIIGRPADALRYTERALLAPDRRAHNSRDPNQDLAMAALLDRRARRVLAQSRLEAAAARGFVDRVVGFFDSLMMKFRGFTVGRQAARLLADETRLVGTFRIGTSRSAVTPTWLVGELVDVLGEGASVAAIARARAEDKRPGADAYYDAFEAEARALGGDEARAAKLAERALSTLNDSEALLRARLLAIWGHVAFESGQLEKGREMYRRALQLDPGVFRRLEIPLPVRVTSKSGPLAGDVVDALADSPRFVMHDGGFALTVSTQTKTGEVCLLASEGSVLACAEAPPPRPHEFKTKEEDPKDRLPLEVELVDEVHRVFFSPRIDLSQSQINSLDGSNQSSRGDVNSLTEEDPFAD